MLTAAARARRRLSWGRSSRFWSFGVGVNGGHHALLDAEGVVEHLDHRDEAVRRARRVRDDLVGVGVERVVVDADHERGVGPVGGRRDDHPGRAAVQVGGGLLLGGEHAGGLQDDVDAEVAPGQLGRVALGQELERAVALDRDRVVGVRDLGAEAAHDRVVLEQVGHGADVAEVVDGDDLDVGTLGVDRPEEAPSDAPEPVDADSNGHDQPPCCVALAQRPAPVRPRCSTTRSFSGREPSEHLSGGPRPGRGVACVPVAMGFGPIWQLGYVVRDLDAALEHWLAAGVGPWYVFDPLPIDRFCYRGGPSIVPDVAVALAYSGTTQVELIHQRDDTPTLYRDFLATSDGGLQHLGFRPSDYDGALAAGVGGRLGGRPRGRWGRDALRRTWTPAATPVRSPSSSTSPPAPPASSTTWPARPPPGTGPPADPPAAASR